MNIKGKHRKGGMIMNTKRTIRVIVVVIGALALLCSHLTVSDALAQGSPDFSGWHAAMAMANLAEEEIRANEQKAVAEHNVKIAQHPVVITEENKEYHNKKDTAE
jgi:hypothetical protein